MSGFFRGPPLMAHLFFIAATLALSAPVLKEATGSTVKAFMVCFGVGVIYGLAAITWASRHILLNFRHDKHPSDWNKSEE